jgi:DNA-binding NtrC family response regulator
MDQHLAKRSPAVRWLRGELPDSSFERLRSAIRTSSLKTRLMIFLIPPVLIILVATGYINYLISKQFINSAIDRSCQLQAMAVKREIELFLDRWREDVGRLSQEAVSADSLRRFLSKVDVSGGLDYLGVAFISQKDANHLVFMRQDGQIAQIASGKMAEIKPMPLIYYEKIKQSTSRSVWLSPVVELEYPFPVTDNPNQKLIRKVIHMAAPCCGNGEGAGYLLVTVDAMALRNILSLYNSNRSPIWAFPRTAEERYFFLFDPEGWILFQSDAVDKPRAELSTHLARSGYSGTLGRQGLESAFRPDSIFERYWSMVADVRAGRPDSVLMTAYQPNAYGRDYHLAYAPIRFKPSLSADPQVVAGVAYMDISRLTMMAGYRHIDTMLIVALAAALVVAGLIFALGRVITRPILKLAEAVKDLPPNGEPKPVALPYYGREITILQGAINTMIATVNRQMADIRNKDRTIRNASLKEQAFLDGATVEPPPPAGGDPVPSIVGFGPRVERLKAEIGKAARVEADVLIIGETGTGKQLAAEAIHGLSARAAAPFISINCGALDENLLLDTLFGHIKGAFTEAKSDRKGAFLEAHQGTLFLDEIQAASPRVQQALLRAISARKIKPLGSDREIEVDVRLFVATNVDLRELIDRGGFREDLYFRLKVITVHTPPLRDQKENIPVLARHFLNLQATAYGRPAKGLSKGALSRLMRYDWPGNIRELQNCITRAVVMTEGQLIHSEDTHLDVEAEVWEVAPPDAVSHRASPRSPQTELPAGLTPRQQKAFAAIKARGRITRGEYQGLIGGNLPARTAIHDLNGLVRRGLLEKTGSGPATHYVVVVGRPEPSNRQ